MRLSVNIILVLVWLFVKTAGLHCIFGPYFCWFHLAFAAGGPWIKVNTDLWKIQADFWTCFNYSLSGPSNELTTQIELLVLNSLSTVDLFWLTDVATLVSTFGQIISNNLLIWAHPMTFIFIYGQTKTSLCHTRQRSPLTCISFN